MKTRVLLAVAAATLFVVAAATAAGQRQPRLVGQGTETGFAAKATAGGRIPWAPAKVTVKVDGHSADDKVRVAYSLSCSTTSFSEVQRSGSFRLTMPSSDSTHVKVPTGHLEACNVTVSAAATALDGESKVHVVVYAVRA